jgi:hypothetical protein
VLARQLLLERARLPLTGAIERMAGVQAQYAPSAYIGLWSRLEGFALGDLTRALERRRVVQGTLMRMTIHIVSARDHPLFAAGTRASRREWWLRSHRRRVGEVDMGAVAALVREALAGGPRHRDELVELLRPHDPTGTPAVWNGAGAWVDLVRVPPSGTWERRRADLFAAAEDWLGGSAADEEEGREHLLRRYLRAFGPAQIAEAADWAGLQIAPMRAAAERLTLRRFRDEEERELVDLPRAPLPGGDVPAPVRYLPTWDAALLVHARRSQILPERFRPLVFHTKTPHSVPTFLVDGAVAGSWRVERTAGRATLVLEPFEPLPAPAREELREEGLRLVRFMEPDATAHAVRAAGARSRRAGGRSAAGA